jgi:hypothetical protein
MLISASQIVVLALGVVVAALSLCGLFAPDKMMKLVAGAMDRDWGIHFAVVVRLILGAALIIAAPGSRFPQVFEVLGWIAVIAAVAIVFMGRERLRKFVAVFQRMSQAMIRIWLLFGCAFGAFLVYGIL